MDPEHAGTARQDTAPRSEGRPRGWQRRKRLLIDPGLQGRLVLQALGHALFFLLFIAGALFLPLASDLARPGEEPGDAGAAALSFLVLHRLFWPAALVALLLIGLHALRSSHRIVGPLLRFRRVFRELAAGRIPAPFQLRRGDALGVELAALNQMLVDLRRQAAEARTENEALLEALAGLGQEASAEIRDRLEQVERRVRSLQERLVLEEPRPGGTP